MDEQQQKPVKVTVGVCGGIAAYKAVELVRLLQDAGLDPHVVMTRAAQQFVQPAHLRRHLRPQSHHQHLHRRRAKPTANKTPPSSTSTRPRPPSALIVAPATADILAKFAHGIADDFLSTLYLATTAPVIIAPAMNVNMWNHPATQANLAILRDRGVHIVEPGSGYLACGMAGGGRLADVPTIVSATLKAIEDHATQTSRPHRRNRPHHRRRHPRAHRPRPLHRQPLQRPMGYALAEAAQPRSPRHPHLRPHRPTPPHGCEIIPVTSAEQMRAAVLEHLAEATIVIMAAAVSDFTA